MTNTYISTLSTFTPQGSVASSRLVSIHCAIFSLISSRIWLVKKIIFKNIFSPLWENLRQVLGTENISESGGPEQMCWVTVILNIVGGHDRIEDSVVDDSVDSDCYRVSRKNLLRRNIKADCSQIHLLVMINARKNKKYSRSFSTAFTQSSQSEDDCSLIFLNNLSWKYFFKI